jgi:Vacuolar sorting 38 and autophagy-related subunit 14
MSCHVCSRAHSSRLSFYCSTCARNQLYQLRLENARLGLEKEALGRQIESAVASERTQCKGSEAEVADDSEQKQPTWAVHVAQTEGALSLTRSKATITHMDMLKSEIKEKRSDISRRRTTLAQRRSDAESANYQLTERQTATLTGVQNNIKRTEHLWHALHNKTAESRVFLCREAASVYGLRQKLRKKNGEVRASYVIGGVTILDLREMNGMPACLQVGYS